MNDFRTDPKIDAMFARIRHQILGVDDDKAREMVDWWRTYADELEAQANIAAQRGQRDYESGLRLQAQEWRADAAALERQLKTAL